MTVSDQAFSVGTDYNHDGILVLLGQVFITGQQLHAFPSFIQCTAYQHCYSYTNMFVILNKKSKL